MIKKLSAALALAFLLITLGSCAKPAYSHVTLTYSAAASLEETLTQIGKNYEKIHPELTFRFDFAGSGAIRQKVASGAPIDGVFLASQSDTDKLGDKVTGATPILGNSLVVIVPKTRSVSADNLPETLLSADKIALGEPSAVPAGNYAIESLKTLKLYETNQAKLVEFSDVTQVLNAVATGNADAGFVYATDALRNSHVKVAEKIPDSTHAPIRYVAATVTDSTNAAAVRAFNAYLKTKAAQTVFKNAGFTPIN
jgi:molybdate transport system substrate-binding protein